MSPWYKAIQNLQLSTRLYYRIKRIALKHDSITFLMAYYMPWSLVVLLRYDSQSYQGRYFAERPEAFQTVLYFPNIFDGTVRLGRMREMDFFSKVDTVTRCQHASSTVYWQSVDHRIKLSCCHISIIQFLTGHS